MPKTLRCSGRTNPRTGQLPCWKLRPANAGPYNQKTQLHEQRLWEAYLADLGEEFIPDNARMLAARN